MFGSSRKKIMKLDSQQRKGISLISKLRPKSVIAEQYRTIRTNIQFSMIDRDVKSIVMTSSGPWEGKSTTAANLASVFTDQGLACCWSMRIYADRPCNALSVWAMLRLDDTFERTWQKNWRLSNTCPEQNCMLWQADRFRRIHPSCWTQTQWTVWWNDAKRCTTSSSMICLRWHQWLMRKSWLQNLTALCW